ncbi:MAG: hypothetical protein FD181_3477 [Prolixibacteraceae bacterium]|nr:MAG: hypothetical protein FD181_3477 [Prolixibacteraceae bacterium]
MKDDLPVILFETKQKWIDGLKKKFDAKTFIQRFTARKLNSKWSKLQNKKAFGIRRTIR